MNNVLEFVWYRGILGRALGRSLWREAAGYGRRDYLSVPNFHYGNSCPIVLTVFSV